MSLTSVASTGAATAPSTIDATASEHHTDSAASGFALLLTGARSNDADGPDSERADSDGSDSTASDAPAGDPGSTGATGDGSQTPKPPVKPASDTDPSGQLAALAALALTPAPDPAIAADATTPPSATDPASVDVIVAPSTASLIEQALAALSVAGADATPVDGHPAPPAPPTLTPVAAPLPATTETPARPEHPVSAPPTPALGSGVGANTTAPNPNSAPAVTDTAGPAPSDRPRSQTPLVPTATGAATFAAAAPAPTAAATNADNGTAAAATVAPPPAEQLVSVLTPLRTTTNGTYTLRLELKPPELGRVEMRVEMKDGVLSASIHAEHEGSAQLVREALSDLRDLLNAGGVRTGDLTVSDGGVGSGSRDGADPGASASTSEAAPSPDDPAGAGSLSPQLDPDSTSLLDVRL